jgi:hypothetical protein
MMTTMTTITAIITMMTMTIPLQQHNNPWQNCQADPLREE